MVVNSGSRGLGGAPVTCTYSGRAGLHFRPSRSEVSQVPNCEAPGATIGCGSTGFPAPGPPADLASFDFWPGCLTPGLRCANQVSCRSAML